MDGIASRKPVKAIEKIARPVRDLAGDGSHHANDPAREIVGGAPFLPPIQGTIAMQNLLEYLGVYERIQIAARNPLQQRE